VTALKSYKQAGQIKHWPVRDYVAATSVGVVGGRMLLDLCYEEDSSADVDMNMVMTGAGGFVELQATAEKIAFDDRQLAGLVELGRAGICQLVEIQRKVLGDR
jgi:ribonuclease PH